MPGKKSSIKKNSSSGSSSYKHTIVVAEDDSDMRKMLVHVLQPLHYNVIECKDGLELLDIIALIISKNEKHIDVDLIISDIRMAGVSGMEILRGTREIKKFPPLILITAFGDSITHNEAQQLGVAAFFDKPFDIDQLLTKVREILHE